MPNALEIMGLTLVEGAKFGSGLLLYFENYFFLTKVKNAPARRCLSGLTVHFMTIEDQASIPAKVFHENQLF